MIQQIANIMLKTLHISNYVLIDQLDIDFEAGFSVITGETGAGKSIILGALALVTGQRADTKSIKQDAEKCVIEAVFNVKDYQLQSFFEKNELDYDENNCVIRREITNGGKSRAFVNDTPVGLNVVRELTDNLIDIHSQHENLLLANDSYQRNVVDLVAQNTALLTAYANDFTHWQQLTAALHKLTTTAEKANADLDYIRFQWQQLDDCNLKNSELEELEQELETLSHAEEIKMELAKIDRLTTDENASLPLIKEATVALSRIKSYIPEGENLHERLESIYIDLKDIAAEAYSLGERVEFNPIRLEWVENRLGELYALLKKHKVESISELIALRDAFEKRLLQIDSFDSEIEELKKQIDAAHQSMTISGEKLTASRQKACPPIKQQLETILSELGMPDICFEITVRPLPAFETHGRDEIQFLFSANKNRLPEPLAQVASGGEMSRLMLAIKSLIANKMKLPTVVFDEIDTGISGDIADRMGKIMNKMSADMQVISITHLPQIAARGKAHYRVFKTEINQRVLTKIVRLNHDERIKEIAQMLSGTQITEAAMQNATELLAPA